MIGLLNANALHIPLADQSVQMVATSPPYYGLRDYGVTNQLGLEPTPEEYVANLVAVFCEIWRVLRDDGVVFLNLGDSYNGSGGAGGDYAKGGLKEGQPKYPGRDIDNLKPKDLIGIPWRVAFALQADGWWLRSDIIWSKPNPMPESVTDRPTKAHEYVFLLTKSQRYFWDQEAVKERYARTWDEKNIGENNGWATGKKEGKVLGRATMPNSGLITSLPGAGRNIRTVWTIATAPYKGAHFATWPPKLVEPMIKAGSSEKGCCPKCGKAWVRVVEKDGKFQRRWSTNNAEGSPYNRQDSFQNTYKFIGWRSACDCLEHEPIPCTVLDPFAGSGTTLLVARQFGRSAVGLDLSFTYLKENATKRLELDKLRAWTG